MGIIIEILNLTKHQVTKLYTPEASCLPDIALGVSENRCSKILCDAHQADSVHFYDLVIDLYSMGVQKLPTINFSDNTLPSTTRADNILGF